MSSSSPSSAHVVRFMASLLRRGAKDTTDGSGQRVPPAGFDLELLPALRGQSINLARRLFSEVPFSKLIRPRLINRCKAGYRDPCSTCSTSSEPCSMALAIAWPWAGQKRRVRRINRSSVPCSNSMRSRSALVDILGVDDTLAHLECQGEPTLESTLDR